jgi:HSP20 family protein
MTITKRNRLVHPRQLAGGPQEYIQIGGNGGHQAANFPATNIYEETDHWVYTFELPGVDRGDVELVRNNNVLTVRGRRTAYFESEESKVYRRESCLGECEFMRSFNLPETADSEKIQARMNNGMLVVLLEKSRREPTRERNIEIH